MKISNLKQLSQVNLLEIFISNDLFLGEYCKSIGYLLWILWIGFSPTGWGHCRQPPLLPPESSLLGVPPAVFSAGHSWTSLSGYLIHTCGRQCSQGWVAGQVLARGNDPDGLWIYSYHTLWYHGCIAVNYWRYVVHSQWRMLCECSVSWLVQW